MSTTRHPSESVFDTVQEMMAIFEAGTPVAPNLRRLAALSSVSEFLRMTAGVPGDVPWDKAFNDANNNAGINAEAYFSPENVKEETTEQVEKLQASNQRLAQALGNAQFELRKRAAQVEALSTTLHALEDDLQMLTDRIEEALRVD